MVTTSVPVVVDGLGRLRKADRCTPRGVTNSGAAPVAAGAGHLWRTASRTRLAREILNPVNLRCRTTCASFGQNQSTLFIDFHPPLTPLPPCTPSAPALPPRGDGTPNSPGPFGPGPTPTLRQEGASIDAKSTRPYS